MAYTTMNATVDDWDFVTTTGKVVPWQPEEKSFTVSEDIIALSCVAKRLGKFAGNIVGDAERLAKSITAEDRFTAQNIRQFYNGKMIVAQLRNEHLTSFRQDLIKLLNTPMGEDGNYTYTDKFAGMIYKLPYFYEYDRCLIDDVFGGEYHDILHPIKVNKEGKSTATLTFISKLDAFRKRVPQVEYWFSDDKDNRVVLHVDKSNPLEALLDHHLENNDITVSGYFSRAVKDTLNFYKVKYWTPVF